AGLQHGQGSESVVGLAGVVVTEVAQQVLDDATHRGEIVHDENLDVLVQDSLPMKNLSRPCRRRTADSAVQERIQSYRFPLWSGPFHVPRQGLRRARRRSSA